MSNNSHTQRQMVPVVPDWCDCNNLTPRQYLLALAILRAILAVISSLICITYISLYPDVTTAILIIIVILCIVNLVHLVVSLLFLYSTWKIDDPDKVRNWLWMDVGTTAVYITLILIFICIIPYQKVFLFLSLKLLFISLWVCFRSKRVYDIYLLNTMKIPFSNA